MIQTSTMTNTITGIILAAICQLSPAKTPIYVDNPERADIERYDTELFNLMNNKKNIVTKINSYNDDFAKRVDLLLVQSKNLAGTGIASATQIKKRLLSGPASKPLYITVIETGRKYLYYFACQAHACNTTNLSMLFEPASHRLVAKVAVQGNTEYLGAPSPVERALIESLSEKE